MRAKRLPLAGVLASHFLFRSGTAVTIFAVPWLVSSSTKSSLSTGIVVAACQVASACGSLFGGHIVDRLGPSWTLPTVGCLGAITIAMLPFAYPETLPVMALLIPLLALNAFFDATASTALDSRIPEIASLAGYPLKTIIGGKSSLGYAAVLLAPVGAGIAANAWSSTSVLWYSSLSLAAAGFLAGGSLVGRAPAAGSESTDTAGALSEPGSHWHDMGLKRFLVISALTVAAVAAMISVVVPHLLLRVGADPGTYGMFLSAAGLGSAIGSGLFGLAGSRISVPSIARSCLVLVFLSLLMASVSSSIPPLIASAWIMGVSTSPLIAAYSYLLYERTPFAARGRALGTYTATLTCATALFLLLAGYVIDRNGYKAVLPLLAATPAIGLCLVGRRRSIGPASQAEQGH